jgi:hypothetical protein
MNIAIIDTDVSHGAQEQQHVASIHRSYDAAVIKWFRLKQIDSKRGRIKFAPVEDPWEPICTKTPLS